MAVETVNQLVLSSRWTFFSPTYLFLLLIVLSPLAPRVCLGTSYWHSICRYDLSTWSAFVQPTHKYSLRGWTDSVSFCIYISERSLLIVTWQHQVQMERRVPRSENYARGGRQLNNISTWKASGLTSPVGECTGNYSNMDVLFIMQKTPTHVTKLSSLAEDFSHSSFQWFHKRLSYIPLPSIVSSVSCGDLQLYKDRWEALSIVPALAPTTVSSEKQGGT